MKSRYLVGLGGLSLVAVMALTFNTQPPVALAQVPGAAASDKPQYTADGKKMIAPAADVYREWVAVGTPLTPHDMNNGEATFPEFHTVYVSPTAWREYKKTGKWPEGTMLVKELISVGSKKATSGNGYFMGEFIGLETAVKDTKKYKDEPGGWAYYSFGHQYPLAKESAPEKTASCNACHKQSAADDFVFTQYYPVLRAAKGGK